MHFSIDQRSRTPIYEQIKDQILSAINEGSLKPDDQLPSMRQLAKNLNLNVNTVKRAYADLDARGLTYSVPGKGIFVHEEAVSNRKVIESALQESKRVLLSSKAKGVSKDEILQQIQSIFEEDPA
ncbi:MAG: GntR family transcriptional regulator [Clostridia bacterium]|nr:GntR family transcriptional regulator [Clostridia bacterium]